MGPGAMRAKRLQVATLGKRKGRRPEFLREESTKLLPQLEEEEID